MNFQKFQLKWKIVKHFAKPKQRVALRKLFRLSKVKTLPRLWKKNSLKKMYRNIQTFGFKMLQECSSWASRNGATKLKHVCWKICKVKQVLAVLWKHSTFNVKWVEVCKMSKVFEQDCIVKCVIFFASLFWLWDFLLENLELENPLMMPSGMSGQISKRMHEKNIFKKRIQNKRFWIFIFWSKFTFLGGCFRAF